MSLTSLLRSPLHTNLTAWLNHYFPAPTMPPPPPLLVGKESSAPADYSLVGTAFDYLFRFQLERLNANYISERNPWVAENGLLLATRLAARQPKAIRSIDIPQLHRWFEEARGHYQLFLRDGQLTPALIRASLLLAKLDVVVRTGRIDLAFGAAQPAEAAQLEKLFQAVDWQPFVAQRQCVLNPSFGRTGRLLVGGADADVLLDGTLIDLKVTATSNLRRAYFHQLIGYYLLSLLHTQDCAPVHPIHTLAVFFPRANYRLSIPVSHYFDPAGFRQRKIEFISLVKEWNLDLVNRENNEFLFTDSSAVSYRVDRHNFRCPHCQADASHIKDTGQTATGRYRYRCNTCQKGFSTVFSAGSSMESAINALLFRNRLEVEEPACVQQELLAESAARLAKLRELEQLHRARRPPRAK